MLAAGSALGMRTRYLGPVGNDDNGRRIREELTRRGVDVAGLIVHEAASRFAIILVDESTGERTVLWHRDSRLALDESEIHAGMLDARALHVDGVDEPAAIRAARLATGSASWSRAISIASRNGRRNSWLTLEAGSRRTRPGNAHW